MAQGLYLDNSDWSFCFLMMCHMHSQPKPIRWFNKISCYDGIKQWVGNALVDLYHQNRARSCNRPTELRPKYLTSLFYTASFLLLSKIITPNLHVTETKTNSLMPPSIAMIYWPGGNIPCKIGLRQNFYTKFYSKYVKFCANLCQNFMQNYAKILCKIVPKFHAKLYQRIFKS